IVAVPFVVVDKVDVYVPPPLSITALSEPSVVASVTAPPETASRLELASFAVTVIVAVPPAVTVGVLLTMVVVPGAAGPGTVVIVALVPLAPPVVAVTVVRVPETVCVVSVIVAI